MIKVIVIDDEPPILNAVAKMIEQLNENFEVVGKSLNGEDALTLIQTLKPDVIFTDIKMPVMDGLSLIEKLNALDIMPVSIILSSYAEFEYARKALKYGVFDYLIKPVNLDVLKDLLSKIYEKVSLLKKAREIQALEKMIKDASMFNKKDLNTQGFEIFTLYKYMCILFCAGSYCSYHSSSLTPGQDFWAKNNLDEIIIKNIKQPIQFWIIDGEHNNEKIVLLGTDHDFGNELKDVAMKIYDLLNSNEIFITAVFSAVFDKIAQFSIQVQNLQNTLRRYICFGVSQLIPEYEIKTASKRGDSTILNSSWENYFTAIITKMENETFKQNINSLLTVCESRNCRQYILENVLQQIYSLFCSIPELNLSDKLVEIHMELNELISNSINYQILCENLSYMSDDLFNSCKSIVPDTSMQDDIIDKIDEYIRLNCFKQINLQTLSTEFGFAPQYLGRKYKKARGITPIDFITQLRISKTKELLKIKPSVSIQNIANSVGYNDPFYLSRVFKLFTGKSPSEFRDS